jgi:hypothetical protein
MNQQQLIHIASELVVVGSLTFYFNKQIKELKEEFKKKYDDLEGKYHELDKAVKILYANVENGDKLVNSNSKKKNMSRKNQPVQEEEEDDDLEMPPSNLRQRNPNSQDEIMKQMMYAKQQQQIAMQRAMMAQQQMAAAQQQAVPRPSSQQQQQPVQQQVQQQQQVTKVSVPQQVQDQDEEEQNIVQEAQNGVNNVLNLLKNGPLGLMSSFGIPIPEVVIEIGAPGRMPGFPPVKPVQNTMNVEVIDEDQIPLPPQQEASLIQDELSELNN